jgi:UDP-N-acetylmuramoylalanine--D-glutamate ligase
VKQLEGYPVEFRLGEHRMEDFTSCDLVVASPAVPPTNEYLVAARKAGVSVTTEIRLFVERCPLPIVAISGTKGKSTTSKLLSLMLASKYQVWLGGNIGKSLLFELPKMKSGEIVLLEISSFMLEYLGEMQWAPAVGLLTMLGSDHLEWHGTQEAYLKAKGNLIRYQTPEQSAVLCETCSLAREFAKQTKAKVVWYGVEGRRRFELTIPGEHNQLNAQAAFAAAECMGISWEAAQQAIREFAGLPHRLELVHEFDGIRFFDDSIATIPQAAAAALRAFGKGRVIQIVGGHDKGLPFEPMCDAIAEHAKAAMCIGESAGKIAGIIRSRHAEYREVYESGTLAQAMAKARELASPGDVVLLSTGCSSYDQFINFEQRGKAFADEAKKLFR